MLAGTVVEMKRRSWWILLCIALVFVACDPSPGRELAFSITKNGDILVRYNPCRRAGDVADLSLVRERGSVYSYEDDEVLWKIRRVSPVGLRTVEIGITPPGFEEIVPLVSSINADELHFVLVKREKSFLANAGFRIQDLRSGEWLRDGKYLSESKFDSLDTCKSDLLFDKLVDRLRP